MTVLVPVAAGNGGDARIYPWISEGANLKGAFGVKRWFGAAGRVGSGRAGRVVGLSAGEWDGAEPLALSLSLSLSRGRPPSRSGTAAEGSGAGAVRGRRAPGSQ